MRRPWVPAVAFRIAVVAGLVVFAAYVGLWIALIVNDGSKSADYTAFMNDVGDTPIRIPVIIMLVMVAWIAIALGRLPREVVSAA